MDIRQGKGIFPAIAEGKILVYKKRISRPAKERTDDISAELARYDLAAQEAKRQLDALIEKAREDAAGQEEADIFKAHRLILDDSAFSKAARDLIKSEALSAEKAVTIVSGQLKDMFEGLDDEYLRQRAADIEDVSSRLLEILKGPSEEQKQPEIPVILFAEDLLAGDIARIERDKLLALVLKEGSDISHAAILAGMMGIPCVVKAGIPLDKKLNGKYCIVDAGSGKIYIEPDEKESKAILFNAGAAQEGENVKDKDAPKEDTAKDEQTRILRVLANITGPDDVDAVLSAGAEGIGLFRTEFLYLGRESFPAEEEQYGIYKGVLERMGKRPVIFRTIDVGADKTAGYLRIPASPNPAMGMRGIRYCLEHTDVFKTQLRAIYRAAAFGNAGILLPMIVSLSEVKRAKEIAEEVKKELCDEGVPFGNAPVGVMIETPAAAAMADLLAKEADFFSIGTNDLTQYMLASDREYQTDYPYFDPYPEAVLRMTQYTCACARKQGIPCCMCGEMAADTALTKRFTDMGIDAFSVSPVYIAGVRKAAKSAT